MANKVSRRFFIGGLASMFALGPRRVFAAAPGAFTGGRPALSFGLLSDIHLGLAHGGGALNPTYDEKTLVKAFEWFRDNGADAVVIAGDLAHHGVVGELKAVADVWFKVFPGDRAPDGRRVERVFVFGNHDWNGQTRGRKVFASTEEAKANALSANPKKWWDEIFHEEWSPIFTKCVKGYDFIGAHWCRGDCHGRDERFVNGLKEFYDSLKRPLDPSKPFFHVQHPHPKGTVHGDGVWGQDDGVATGILSAYPNAIAFSGHSHTSLTDERSVWQGAFTSVGCASLRNVSGILPGIFPLPEGGYENGKTPKNQPGGMKAMEVIPLMNCRQGQFVRVYGDRVVISRREFVSGASLGNDLVMPLSTAESRPFAFAGRAAAAKPPAFPAGATLGVKRTTGALRDKKKGKVDVWELSMPAATAEPTARPAAFEITASAPGGFSRRFAMSNPSMRFPASDPRVSSPVVFRVACERLPKEALTFSVCAVSCWGRRSAPLVARIDSSPGILL